MNIRLSRISYTSLMFAALTGLAVLLVQCAEDTGCVVTAEDHNVLGGLGSAVAESLSAHCPCPIEFVGVQDTFGESGEPEELATQYRLTGPFIAEAARRAIHRARKRNHAVIG